MRWSQRAFCKLLELEHQAEGWLWLAGRAQQAAEHGLGWIQEETYKHLSVTSEVSAGTMQITMALPLL